MTDPSITFNLWREPWIRVVDLEGCGHELGIEETLRRAHQLHALYDTSPLTVAGIHRLLVAILQFLYEPTSLSDLDQILKAGQFDSARITAFAATYAARFDLFDPDAPFGQTGDVSLTAPPKASELKPVASLFPEVPAATNRAHFHHTTDEQHRVCPACCARGIVVVPAFASSGGQGIKPSINGVPPIYILPAGDTLWMSLALSLTTPDFQPTQADRIERSREAPWTGSTTVGRSRVVTQIGYLESLTFPARRMRLLPVAEATNCTQCGAATHISVRHMLYEMGHELGQRGLAWDDPFVAFRKPSATSKTDGLVPLRPQPGRALWRDFSTLLLSEREEQLRPKIVRQIGVLWDNDMLTDIQTLRFRCISLRTDGKAKIFEWVDEALEVPPALLRDDAGIMLVEQAIRWATEGERVLLNTFEKHLRPESRRSQRIDAKTVRFKSLRSRLQHDYWAALREPFRQLVEQASEPDQREAAQRRWAAQVVHEGQRIFNDTVQQVGLGADALRTRVEAQDECARWLNAKRKEWMGEQYNKR